MEEIEYVNEIKSIINNTVKECKPYFERIATDEFISKTPVFAMSSVIGFVGNGASEEKRDEIHEFSEMLLNYTRFSIDELLSFKTKNIIHDSEEMELIHENGQIALEEMVKMFASICNYS